MITSSEGTSEKRQRPQKRIFGNRGGRPRPQRKANSEKEPASPSPEQDRKAKSPSPRTTSSPAKHSTATASPSTPKKRSNYFSTPSSSPYSDLDLSKDVFERLSPKKARLDRASKSPADAKRRSFRSQLFLTDDDDEANNGQGEDGLKSGPLEDKFVSRPSRLAYASRMAPKKVKQPAQPSSPCSELDNATETLEAVKSIEEREADEEARKTAFVHKLLTPDVFDTESQSNKSLERWSQKTEEMDMTSKVSEIESDWKNLEELDEENMVEGSNDIRSIVNLRTTGTNLRSTAEIDDILSGLAIKNRLGALKATSVELVKLLMDAPQDGDIPIDWKPTPISSSTFIASVRRTNTTAALLSAMQKAGAGEGKDFTFDISLGLAYMRLFEEKDLNEVITICPNFLSTVKRIISARYDVPSKRDKHHNLLQNMASILQSFRLSDEVLKPDRVILQAVISIIFSTQCKNADGVEVPPLSPRLSEELQSFQRLLWDKLFDSSSLSPLEGEETDTHHLASDCLSIRQICVLLSILGARYRSIISLEFKQMSELVQLNDRLAKWIGCKDDDLSHASAEALQACLQYQVNLTNQEQSDNCKTMLHVSDMAVLDLAQIIVKSVHVTKDINRDDVYNIRLLDLAALALGILTNLLQHEAAQTIQQFVSDNNPDFDAVSKMTTLFLHTSHQTDDQHSTLFSGCLAFFCSLLIVKAEEVKEVKISHIVTEKMNKATPKHLSINQELAKSLDRFADSGKKVLSVSEADEQHSAQKQEISLIQQLSEQLRRGK